MALAALIIKQGVWVNPNINWSHDPMSIWDQSKSDAMERIKLLKHGWEEHNSVDWIKKPYR